MFYENKKHLPYEEEQRVITNDGGEELVSACRLEQHDFSQFYLQTYRPLSPAQKRLEGASCLCYYETKLVRAQMGRVCSWRIFFDGGRAVSQISYVCKKISFIDADFSATSTIDYIIPYARIQMFDELSDSENGGSYCDAISIMGQRASWKLKNLLRFEDGTYTVSPFAGDGNAVFSDHLILSTREAYCAEVEEEAKNIAYLLQLALGKFSLPVCRIVRQGVNLSEIVPQAAPNSIPGFWSPLGRSRNGERGRIKQFIEHALPAMSQIGDGMCMRHVLATYATMNMQHVHLEHRLLFSFMLLDTLYNLCVPSRKVYRERAAAAQNLNCSSLEKDLAVVFRRHQVDGAERYAKMVVNELQKHGKGRGKVQPYEQRIRQLFDMFDCVPPVTEDLAKRNEIMHEGALKDIDAGESLRVMTRMMNSVTRLLFKMLRYEGTVDYFPENEWNVVNTSK